MISIIDSLIENWHPLHTILSEPLNGLSKYFIIYKQYCTNYEKAEKMIGKVKENP